MLTVGMLFVVSLEMSPKEAQAFLKSSLTDTCQ